MHEWKAFLKRMTGGTVVTLDSGVQCQGSISQAVLEPNGRGGNQVVLHVTEFKMFETADPRADPCSGNGDWVPIDVRRISFEAGHMPIVRENGTFEYRNGAGTVVVTMLY